MRHSSILGGLTAGIVQVKKHWCVQHTSRTAALTAA
jgi:hypothetical protein